MTFTTWCDLKQQLLDDMSDGGAMRMQSYSVATAGGSRSVTYRGFDEWKKAFEYVCAQCDLEAGRASYKGRMRAGQGGRG